MAKQPTPTNNKPAPISNKPKAFKHVKNIRPEFMMASTGEREKAKLRTTAPKLQKQFARAHEGPREKLAKPKLQPAPTPKGNVTKEVHTQVEREKRARNRQKDEQMKKWRERKVPQPSRPSRPKVDLRKTSPDVYLSTAEKKKQAFTQLLQQKQARKQRRGRSR